MATTRDYIAYLEDGLRGVSHLRFRSMFGEYAVYYRDRVVGLVCDQTLFIKVTPGTSAILAGVVGTAPPYRGGRDAFVLTETEIEDTVLMTRVIEACHADVAARSPPARTARLSRTPRSGSRSQPRTPRPRRK
jgi:TfoX/Sxy family transcriptional regulator of competence genes